MYSADLTGFFIEMEAGNGKSKHGQVKVEKKESSGGTEIYKK